MRTSFRAESARGSASISTFSLYLSCVQFASHVRAAGSPERCSTGGNSSTFSDRATAIASSSCCFASASSSLGAAASLGLPLQLLLEVQGDDDQELLEPVVQRPGDLLARMVLGERQVPRHPAQLRRPVFQFGRALLKGHRGTLAFGDVGHERECAPAARRRHVIDGDFDRKRGSVLARADEVQAARWARAVAKDRRNQALDRLADQLFGGPAEHHLDRTIGKDEHPARVRRHDALRGRLEQRPQRAIVFLVATRLEGILSPAALGDVEFEPREPRDLAGRVAIGSSQTLDPSHGSVGAQDTVGVIPRILRLQNLFERAAHPRTVVGMHTREPRLKQRRALPA